MVVPQTEKARWPNCVRVCRMMAAQDVVERTLVNSINVLYCCALPFSWQLFFRSGTDLLSLLILFLLCLSFVFLLGRSLQKV